MDKQLADDFVRAAKTVLKVMHVQLVVNAHEATWGSGYEVTVWDGKPADAHFSFTISLAEVSRSGVPLGFYVEGSDLDPLRGHDVEVTRTKKPRKALIAGMGWILGNLLKRADRELELIEGIEG